MAETIEFDFNYLRQNLHLVCLPPDREWGILRMDNFPYIAFLNIENGITKRKLIIRNNLNVEVYLKEKACPWIKIEKLKTIKDIEMILYLINNI